MRKNKKKMIGGFISLLLLSLLAACGPTSESGVEGTPRYVYENEAFRVQSVETEKNGESVTIRGEARVYEANVQYYAEDGHDVLAEGFVTASASAPEWGAFEFTIQVNPEDMHMPDSYLVVLYEENIENGKWLHQIEIPIALEKFGKKSD